MMLSPEEEEKLQKTIQRESNARAFGEAKKINLIPVFLGLLLAAILVLLNR